MERNEKEPRPNGGDDRECSTCWGFGLWAIGDPNPMGPMDAREGVPTQKCPECGANANPRKGDKES